MRKTLISILILIILWSATGCSPETEKTNPSSPVTAPVSGFSVNKASPAESNLPVGSALAVQESNNLFAFDLYHRIQAVPGNLFYSPFSISTALTMVYAGTAGDTAGQMAGVLHLNRSDNTVNSKIRALQQDLENRNSSEFTELSITNALWGEQSTIILSEYLQQMNAFYAAAFHTVDFTKALESSREINQWVSDNTHNHIQEFLQPESIEGATLVITNAVYFKAPWQFKFVKGTTDEVFYTLNGEQIRVPMMKHEVMTFKYIRGENYQAVDLPYQNTDLSMLVILPDEGQFTDFENSLDNTRLNSILESLKKAAVILTMPKFEFESNYRLNDYLQALGMTDVFGPADFSGMTAQPGLFLTDVLHSTYISVDENGTEAAAGTGAIVASATKNSMVVNRPYLFLIRDNETGTIIFIGRVLNPILE